MASYLDKFTTLFDFKADARSLKNLERRIDNIRRKLDGAGQAMQRGGAVLTAGLVGIATAGIKTDAALRTLEARSGATADQLARFKQQAYEVGSQLPLNTADILRAQTAFVQLGNSIDQAFDATPGIAMAAVAAEGVNIEDAARFASIGLRAFGLEAKQTTYLLDQMLLAETKTPASMREIGEAFRFSAQSAADAGLNTQAYIAILGTLAGSGRSAEESSQGLNVLLTKLAKGMSGVGRGGKMVTDVLDRVGVSGEDIQKQLDMGPEGIFNILSWLRDATEGDSALLTSVLGSLVGESYASAFSFLVQNVDNAKSVFEDLGGAAGESARQAKIQMKGLSGSWELFKAQLDTLRNVLSDLAVGPSVERALRTVAGLMEQLTKVGEDGEFVNKFWLQLIGYVAVAGPLLIGVGTGFRVAAFALGGLLPLMRGLSVLLAPLTVAIRALGLAVIANPIVAAIAAIIGAITLLVMYWDDIPGAVMGAIDTIRNAWTNLLTWLTKDAGIVADVLRGWGVPVDGIFSWIIDAWNSVLALFSAGLDFSSIDWVGAVSGLYAGLAGAVVGVDWGNISGAIITGILAALTFGSDIVARVFTGLTNAIGGVQWGSIGNTIGRLIRDGLIGLWNVYTSLVSAIVGFVVGAVTTTEGDSSVAAAITGLGSAILGLLSSALRAGAGVIAGIILGLLGVQTENPFQWVTDAWQGVIDKIKALWGEFVETIWSKVPAPIRFLIDRQTEEQADTDAAKASGVSTMDAVADGVKSAGDVVGNAVKGQFRRARELFAGSDAERGPFSDLTASGRAIMETLASGVRMAAGDLDSAIMGAIGMPLPVGVPASAIDAMRQETAAITNQAPTNYTLNIDRLEVIAEGGDPVAIADGIQGTLGDAMRRLVEQGDTQVVA